MAQAPSAKIEYNIYTFDIPSGKSKGQSQWKLSATLSDMNEAMSQAEKLLLSTKYEKVEVKKKFFDEKKNRAVDLTLKTYEYKSDAYLDLIIIILGAIAAGMVAFALAYFLTLGG